jgi:protein-L-isoaspartate(D-aspartate) O-methyltransferase
MRLICKPRRVAWRPADPQPTLSPNFVEPATRMDQMRIDQARLNMIENQIRAWEVLDQRVLDVMSGVPREHFAPPRYHDLAFADTEIPLGHGQTMMAPKVEGRLLQALDVQPSDTILEVGTGSGYLTALFTCLGHHVYSVEIFPDLSTQAGERLAAHGLRNATLETGDAAHGWEAHAPYDVIALTGSLYALPDSFRQSLKVGGRLFVVLGQAPAMEAVLITREQDGWARENLFETVLAPLVNAPRPPRFVF